MKLHTQVYTSFITCSHIYIKGRVLRDGPIIGRITKNIFWAVYYTFLRAMSREVKNARVELRIDSYVYDVETDSEGYFEVFENIEHRTFNSKIITVITSKGECKSTQEAELNDYSLESPIGIISDIDDTILMTGVKSFFKFKVVLNTLFLNPFRRKPIDNAADAFQYLVNTNPGNVPVIYLSNSPWNLFQYLQSFLGFNNFPEGIILLRDMGWQLLKSKSIAQRNKFIEIEKLLIAFSDTNFILIGDTGELDYDIYSAAKEKYPERISKIIMNSVGNKKKEAFIRTDMIDKPHVHLVRSYIGIDQE